MIANTLYVLEVFRNGQWETIAGSACDNRRHIREQREAQIRVHGFGRGETRVICYRRGSIYKKG